MSEEVIVSVVGVAGVVLGAIIQTVATGSRNRCRPTIPCCGNGTVLSWITYTGEHRHHRLSHRKGFSSIEMIERRQMNGQ
jgi:hypothetical protein